MQTVELVYGLGIAGAVIAMARNIFITMSLKINVEVLMGQLVKLIEAGNIDRARKLCEAAPRAYIMSGLIPALKVFAQGDAKRGDLVGAYEQGVATRKPLLTLGRIVGVVAGLLAVGGLVLGIMHAESVPPEGYAAPIIAGVLVAGGEVLTTRIKEQADAGFGRLLEVLKEARR